MPRNPALPPIAPPGRTPPPPPITSRLRAVPPPAIAVRGAGANTPPLAAVRGPRLAGIAPLADKPHPASHPAPPIRRAPPPPPLAPASLPPADSMSSQGTGGGFAKGGSATKFARGGGAGKFGPTEQPIGGGGENLPPTVGRRSMQQPALNLSAGAQPPMTGGMRQAAPPPPPKGVPYVPLPGSGAGSGGMSAADIGFAKGGSVGVVVREHQRAAPIRQEKMGDTKMRYVSKPHKKS